MPVNLPPPSNGDVTDRYVIVAIATIVVAYMVLMIFLVK